VTQGDSKEKLVVNIQEATNTFLEEPEETDYIASFPDEPLARSQSIVEMPVNPAMLILTPNTSTLSAYRSTRIFMLSP
jgi:hypothetical protein